MTTDRNMPGSRSPRWATYVAPTSPARIREIRRDTEHRAREFGDAMMLSHGAAYVTFLYALERGWCTQVEHDDAKQHYGNLWNYCGD